MLALPLSFGSAHVRVNAKQTINWPAFQQFLGSPATEGQDLVAQQHLSLVAGHLEGIRFAAAAEIRVLCGEMKDRSPINDAQDPSDYDSSPTEPNGARTETCRDVSPKARDGSG